MKKTVFFTLIIVFVLLSACSLNNSAIESNENLKEENKNLIESNRKAYQNIGDLTEHYETLAEMKEDSELIAEVTVKDNPRTIIYSGTFTNYELIIKDVIKGDPSLKGNEINLIEIGDYYAVKNHFIQVNGEYLLFLKKYVGPIVDDAYVTVGAYQGKFIVDKKGKVIYYGDIYSGVKYFQDELSGLPLEEAKEKIKNSK